MDVTAFSHKFYQLLVAFAVNIRQFYHVDKSTVVCASAVLRAFPAKCTTFIIESVTIRTRTDTHREWIAHAHAKHLQSINNKKINHIFKLEKWQIIIYLRSPKVQMIEFQFEQSD